MKTLLRAVVAVCLGLASEGCGGSDGGGPTTQAMPVTYPGGFPVIGAAPAGATWYEVSGLAAGTMYTATLSVAEPGPNADLEVYSVLEPTPPNMLCAGRTDDSFDESCSFTAGGTTAFVMILNKGAIPPGGMFMDGAALATLDLSSP